MKIIGLKEYIRKLDNISNAYNKLPHEVAAIAVRFSKDRFRSQDWYDNNRESWQARKRKRGSQGSKRSQTLLVDTGRLKRSIRKISADSKLVIIGTDVPYALIHNTGGVINKNVTVKSHTRKRKNRSFTVKSHNRKMNLKIPKRQFIGDSNRLEMELFLHIESQMEAAFKK